MTSYLKKLFFPALLGLLILPAVSFAQSVTVFPLHLDNEYSDFSINSPNWNGIGVSFYFPDGVSLNDATFQNTTPEPFRNYNGSDIDPMPDGVYKAVVFNTPDLECENNTESNYFLAFLDCKNSDNFLYVFSFTLGDTGLRFISPNKTDTIGNDMTASVTTAVDSTWGIVLTIMGIILGFIVIVFIKDELLYRALMSRADKASRETRRLLDK